MPARNRKASKSPTPRKNRKSPSAHADAAPAEPSFWSRLSLWRVFLLLLSVGFAERICSLKSQESFQHRRIGFHQGKTEARWLYFFISHVYDSVLNPWHWDEQMRTEALKQCDFKSNHITIDVGAGTGFTSEGVCKYLDSCKDQLTMVDQSTAQLAQAKKKASLEGVVKQVGDAENLEKIATSHYDRYTSAGSIEYWPHPHRGIEEAWRVVKPGGKATIIGPVRPTWWLSRFFADMWYLFPEEDEYKKWFNDAGFENIKIHAITPSWYKGDRSHGLIMGFVVTGEKPATADPAASAADPVSSASAEAVASAEGMEASSGVLARAWNLLMAAPRFVLGNIGGIYYAILPVYMYVKNEALSTSSGQAAMNVVLLVTGLLLLFRFQKVKAQVLPGKGAFRPLGASDRLYAGIAGFYNEASPIWERVWGEHMHSGHYGSEGEEEGSKSHLQAQDDMIERLLAYAFDGDDDENGLGACADVLDCGCGVGGSTRHIARAMVEAGAAPADIRCTGISLSPHQIARARRRTADAEARGELPKGACDFQVANALSMPFADESFDLVWSLESGEHMPDKEQWLREVWRVLRPGGTFVCATWCHREEGAKGPLDDSEVLHLQRICKNYWLPEWVPLSRYVKILDSGDDGCEWEDVDSTDWTKPVLPFWPAVIWSALSPINLVQLLFAGWQTIKGAITAVLMMQGFSKELLVFGTFRAKKTA